MTSLTKWYGPEPATLALPEDEDTEQIPLVISMKYHSPSQWRLETDKLMEIAGSNAGAELLRLVWEGLEVDTDDDGRVISADLTFKVGAELAQRATALIERVRVWVKGFANQTEIPKELVPMVKSKRDVKKDKKTGEIRSLYLTCNTAPEAQEIVAFLRAQGLRAEIPYFTNSYRLTSCVPDQARAGQFWLTANLARQEIIKGKKKTRKILSLINSTTGFQQLLASFMRPPELENAPQDMIPGICQEVAQQTTSYLGQLDSERVKGEVVFPTMETRDPAERAKEFNAAIAALLADIRPLERQTARELDPSIPPEDPRGERIVITDERWLKLIRSAGEPKPLTLFFVKSDTVRIFRGETRLPTDVTRASLHRPADCWQRYSKTEIASGRQTESGALRAGKKTTALVQYYAAIPVRTDDDPEIREALSHRDERATGRKLPLNLAPAALHGDSLTARQRQINPEDLLIPLEFDQKRIEPILNSNRYQIKWARRIRRGEDRFLQLTIGVHVPPAEDTMNILGVAFGLDASAFWCLVDDSGTVITEGQLGPNQQIKQFLTSKARLEWDQKKGRWIGGRRFSRSLESIAHRNCNLLLEMTKKQSAALAVEDLTWVEKSGPDSKRNTLFTALNFGQTRRFLGYKGPLSGCGKPWFASGYVTGHSCPSCRALSRGQVKAEKRLTYWENGKLHCRSCKYESVPTGEDKARAAALDLVHHRQEKRKEENK